MNKSILPDALSLYIERTFVHESETLKRLRDETAAMPQAGMQISAEQGEFLTLLLHLIGARHTLEVGVFTGYSSLVTALAIPEEGRHVACDINADFTGVAQRHWDAAGVAHKIELRLGPAIETLDTLIAEGARFDFCFIDADKPNYCGYYERAVQMVRSNGVIAVDNTIWSGRVADTSNMEEATVSIRQLNEMVANDPRVESVLLPIGDGMTLARKI
ncbi:MAG TPA: class I SAM-dependent methyltransferase [Fimbriimonas sp.]|nr:class I SAM-dependent methyltransferase [Fimbriimonas sp.]